MGLCRQLIPVTVLVMVVNEGMLKRILSQDRPAASCLLSKGMPSSHSALSIAWAVSIVRATSEHDLMRWYSAVLFAVPWARVQVGDHSIAQVVAGGAVGIATAFVVD